jgi:hypothetical protein
MLKTPGMSVGDLSEGDDLIISRLTQEPNQVKLNGQTVPPCVALALTKESIK